MKNASTHSARLISFQSLYLAKATYWLGVGGFTVYMILFYSGAFSFPSAPGQIAPVYRYENGQCGFRGEVGRNEGLQECGQARFAALRFLTLRNPKLARLTATQSTWMRVSMSGGDWRAAELTGAQIRESDFSEGDFAKANLRGVKAFRTSFRGSKFNEADLRSVVFQESDLSSCDFRGADLRDAVFLPSTSRGALFDRSTKLPFSKEEALRREMVQADGS